MPKGRTPRPHYKDITPTQAAEKLAKSVRRWGRIEKDELAEAYSRVINPDGLSEAALAKKAQITANMVLKVDSSVKLEKGALQFYVGTRGRPAKV